MDISIIIVSYNTVHLLHEVVTKLRAASVGLKTEIIFVDNASKDNSVEVLRRDFPDCALIVNTQNVGFGRANNQALALASGRTVLLVNTDAFVKKTHSNAHWPIWMPTPSAAFWVCGYKGAMGCCNLAHATSPRPGMAFCCRPG